MTTQIGARVGALQSSSETQVFLFGYGTFQGFEIPPDGFFGPNPKIELDSGEIIWGFQCWWAPENLIKAYIGDREVITVPVPTP